ncbi:CPBP family intramembrane glutamic endopeptidase [Salinirubrum litoreum]|uniref:CPBP family intramembrane glutamic endopeptidase n=1 Tax=Salinirubrum litoreum TaxID=1126234 RepID=A0ABD5RF03_9EURY
MSSPLATSRTSTPSRVETLPYFLAVGAAIFLGIHFVVPWLVAQGVPLLFAFSGALFLPILAGLLVALGAYRRAGGRWRRAALVARFRLARPSRREWLIFVGAAVGVLLLEGLLEPVAGVLVATLPLPVPPVLPALFDPRVSLAVPPTEFMGVTLAGAWWVVAVWTVAFVINVGGEELLWRGYLLPRQEAVFGRWAWLVNGLLWVVAVHAFMWWTLVGLLPTGLVTPYLVQRYESTWAGIVVHGLGNALWLGLLVVGVVGG